VHPNAGRPPATWAGHRSAWISGSDRRLAAISGPIPARDLRGIKRSRRSLCQIHAPICRAFYGSDGTRTRDLRRDRPSRAQRQPAITVSEQLNLEALFAPYRLRSAWLSQSSNRRLGHEWPTKSCLHGQREAGRGTSPCAARHAERRLNSSSSLPCSASNRVATGRLAPRLAGIAGRRREPPGTSCGISAGCFVVQVANHPGVCRRSDERSIGPCGQRSARDDAFLVSVASSWCSLRAARLRLCRPDQTRRRRRGCRAGGIASAAGRRRAFASGDLRSRDGL